MFRVVTLERGLLTSNDFEEGTPNTFALEQNYPNPFNPTTNIKFALPKTADVTLTIYNMLGQKVNTLINEKMTSGFHIVPFDASNLSSGMYIYRIQAGSFTSTKKMLLIK
ncbi:MAG: T9SS type A sorting domain-containing protein [Balneola sp.]